MKKLILALLLSTSLFAKVAIIEKSNGITLYCIDGYVFIHKNFDASSPIIQMFIARKRDGIPIPRQCIYQ